MQLPVLLSYTTLPLFVTFYRDCALCADTGSEVADQIFTVLLSTSMFVGGVVGFVLDNTVPGLIFHCTRALSPDVSPDYENVICRINL